MAKGHKDKVAVITGAAGGIGQAFAKRLAEDGVHIAIVDVGDGGATVKMVEDAARQAIAVKCDVASETSVAAMAKEVGGLAVSCDVADAKGAQAAIETAAKAHGPARVLVNCAGIGPAKRIVGRDDGINPQIEGGRSHVRDVLSKDQPDQVRAHSIGHDPRRADGFATDGADSAVAIFHKYPDAPAHITFSSNSLSTRIRT